MNKAKLGTVALSLIAGLAASVSAWAVAATALMIQLSKSAQSDVTFNTSTFLQHSTLPIEATMIVAGIGVFWLCVKHRKK